MPIYEYQCTECGHHFDVIQKIGEEHIKMCPKCSANKVIRLVSAAGFQLKGSGWYATDFKTKNKSSDSTSDKTAEKSKADKTTDTSSTSSGSQTE